MALCCLFEQLQELIGQSGQAFVSTLTVCPKVHTIRDVSTSGLTLALYLLSVCW